MDTTNSYQYWHLDTDSAGILYLAFDRTDATANSMNLIALQELDSILNSIQSHLPKGLIITSKKDNGFILGADIFFMQSCKEDTQIREFLELGQAVVQKISDLNCPTVAAINGSALGGGCEIVLGCDYRLMIADDKARIGLPEVMLGIQPGWGGTVRLPNLIGGFEAMKLILTGRALKPKQANKLGLIDRVVPYRQLYKAAVSYIIDNPPTKKPSHLQKLTNNNLMRQLIGKLMSYQLNKKIKEEQYKAPYLCLRNFVEYGPLHPRAYDIEIESDVTLFHDATTKNLFRLFILQQELKNQEKNTTINIDRVHVIGGGVMGGDIAAYFALKGKFVTLQDLDYNVIAKAIKRAHKLFKKKLSAPKDVTAALDRLIPDVNGNGVKNADLIIEAVVEKLEVKQQIFADLESKAKSSAILATNTSTIPLEEIASTLKNPQRLIGLHFFNPVAKMQLVEVVCGEKTDDSIIKQCVKLTSKIGKLPVKVKSSPGFLINRILIPYLMEAMILLDEGVDKVNIDKAAMKFGMPMGPIALADTVGIDVCYSVAQNMISHFGGEIPHCMEKLYSQGNYGVKTNKGFYNYKNGKKVKEASTSLDDIATITDRLILSLVNEAIACLNENIVENSDILDIAMVMGTGFAPFRGGPINYLRSQDTNEVKQALKLLEERFGKRFSASNGWDAFSAA